jgi:polar amino acid transport system substrate-binding protein
MKKYLLLFLLFITVTQSIYSQQLPPGKDTVYVGVYENRPFAHKDELGRWDGIAVDLWLLIAQKQKVNYRIVEIKQDSMAADLNSGKIDIVANSLILSADTYKDIELTYPFYTSSLAYATKNTPGKDPLVSVFEIIISWSFLKLAIIFVLCIIPVGILIWLFERKADKSDYGGKWRKGLGMGVFWAGTTFTTIAGEKNPSTTGGRIVTLTWMFISVIAVSFFTATVTNIINQDINQPMILNQKDFYGKPVGLLKDIDDYNFKTMGAKLVTFDNSADGFKALKDGKIDAFVSNEYMLRYDIKELNYDDVILYPMRAEQVSFSFGMKHDSPIRDFINSSILDVLNTEEYSRIEYKYLDSY